MMGMLTAGLEGRVPHRPGVGLLLSCFLDPLVLLNSDDIGDIPAVVVRERP